MADQFFIFGEQPDGKNPENPVLLCCYPSIGILFTEPEIVQIMDFCFPAGFKPIAKSYAKERVIISEFEFHLNSPTSLTYGICCQMRAIADEEKRPFFATPESLPYPFCLCLLSRTPYLSSHFQFLSYLALAFSHRVFGTKRQVLPPLLPQIENVHPPLGTVPDGKCPLIALYPYLSMPPKFLVDDLRFYFALSTRPDSSPRPPIKLSSSMNLFLPTHLNHQQCLAYPSLHLLFSLFSVKDVVRLYTAAILELHILFKSHFIHNISLVVESIAALLDPFNSTTAILPVVPNQGDYRLVLQTPTPFVAGICSDPQKLSTHSSSNSLSSNLTQTFSQNFTQNFTQNFAQNLMANFSQNFNVEGVDVLVDLDNQVITEVADFPRLPNEKTLIQKITALLSDKQKAIKVPSEETQKSLFAPLKHNPDYDKFMEDVDPYVFPILYTRLFETKFIFPPFVIDAILLLFGQIIAPELGEMIKECFVTDLTEEDAPVTVCNKGLLLIRVPEEDRDFYQSFMGTQLFSDFSEEMADKFAQQKSASSVETFPISSGSSFRESH